MLENISNLVLVVCLATSVAGQPPGGRPPMGIIQPPGGGGGPAGRIKRQWDFPEFNSDPYGHCEKPSMPIPHGGIKLFPTSDFDDIYDNSCNNYGGQSNFLGCQPKFYCNEGYEVKGNIDLECVENEATGVYKWEGDIPTCVTQQFLGYTIYIVIPIVAFVVCIISAMIRRSVRSRSTQRRCVSRTTIVIPPSSTVPTGRSILSGGPPPYARFDDSNIQVPREGTIPSTGTTPNTQAK